MAWAMSTLALALSAGGAGTSAYGRWRAGGAAAEAGRAQQRAAESEAGLLDYNAAVADLQAKDAVARGAEEESRFRQGVRTLIGGQRAGFAAGNVDVGSGSAVDVQADAAFLGELDALTVRNNARREAWGFKVQAEDLRKRAEITRREGVQLEKAGRAERAAARWGAAGTLLGTGGSLLAQRYGYGHSGGD